MTFAEKKKIADNYLRDTIGLCWDDLSDINSLHDVDDKEGIIELCDERIEDLTG